MASHGGLAWVGFRGSGTARGAGCDPAHHGGQAPEAGDRGTAPAAGLRGGARFRLRALPAVLARAGVPRISQGRPEKALWGATGGFLAAGVGRAERGSRWRAGELRDRRELLCREQSLEAFERFGSQLLLKGHLRCADGSLSSYALILRDDGERGLVLSVTLGEPLLNRLYLAWHRDPDERFFGFGERSGTYDLSGRRLAIVGTGSQRSPATEEGDRSGGATLGFYFTSRLRAFYSQSSAYQVFDLRDGRHVGLEVHEGRLMARIYNGDSQDVLLARQASVVGTLPTAPGPK